MLSTKAQKPIWKATLTRISAQKLLSMVPESLMNVGSGISRNIRNTGMSNACGGSRLAARKKPSRARLNRKLNRASTNATVEARNRVSRTAGTVMISEFLKCRPNWPCSHACW